MNIDLSVIAQAITTANQGKPSFYGKVYNSQGKAAGFVGYRNNLVKSKASAVSVVSHGDASEVLETFERMLGCDMPDGGYIKLKARIRKE
jgi:hypothetical protein